ncbi:sugar ABC transporter substrate-binding protein [Amycolatopsis jejuensis]|uniref:sugar ABC transporter substrate-binding protein n=1 Tax=Amycolatopsis jejuensis TaxID=330084 RepID=UPI000A03FD20|nr:substrate-binding domain-containing protein [Amycolatopsis jejuensis]
MRTMSKIPLAAIVVSVVSVLVTACGGGAAGSTGNVELSAAQKAVVADAEAAFAKYSKVQPLETVPSLPQAPPRGKTMTLITCSLPVCATLADGAASAARALGWQLTTLNSNSTPQGFLSAMDQVAANPPDAFAYISALPDSSIATQLNKIAKAGTKIVALSPIGNPLKTPGPVQAVVGGEKDTAMSGRMMAQSVVADAHGPANSVFVWDPSFAGVWGPIKDAYEGVLKGAGSTPGVLEVSNANIGKTVPSQIVSYLQANPDTKYVALAVVDYNAGLDSALRAAGLLNKVKIISRAANPAALKAINDGTQWASVGLELASSGYRCLDQLARLMMGVPLGDKVDQAGWEQIYVKGNVTQTSAQPEAPDYERVYQTAWHVG